MRAALCFTFRPRRNFPGTFGGGTLRCIAEFRLTIRSVYRGKTDDSCIAEINPGQPSNGSIGNPEIVLREISHWRAANEEPDRDIRVLLRCHPFA